MLQAPIFDGLSFDPFALFNDGLRPAEVGVGGCDVIQALVIALMVVMLDERLDLGFEVAWQIVVFEQDAVFQGLVPALDLALGLGNSGDTILIRCSPAIIPTEMARIFCCSKRQKFWG